jgi:signal transduction histidine kinase
LTRKKLPIIHKIYLMTVNFRILILEDNHYDAQLTLWELKKSTLEFQVKIVDNKTDYIKAITEFQPNVILSDHSLPTIYSSQALVIAKEQCPDCIFILITGTVSEEFAVKILHEGADDYLLKSSLTRLPAAIINSYDKKKAEREREENLSKLKEANQELKTFIYRASHDLRGPVSSLRGLINLTKNSTLDNKTVSLIEMMDKSANRLDTILVELIETVRTRDQEVKNVEIDLDNLTNEIIDQYAFLKGFERLRFKINNKGKHALHSDKRLVTSILQNVIKNSILYQNFSLPESLIVIDFSDVTGGKKIVITDNGMGIQKDLLKNIFEMFYRANLLSEGTGLGLYLVKIAVEKLGGTIAIDSEERAGTTVTIFIPTIESTTGIRHDPI